MNRGNHRDGHESSHHATSAALPHSRSEQDVSAEHRRKLEAMFGGGGSGSHEAPVVKRVFSSPRRIVGRPPSPFKVRLETLRNAREPEEIERAADAFLKHHQCPDDMEILLKFLQHSSEKVQREALREISALVIQKRIGNTFLLTDRLSELATRELEPTTRSCVDGLRKQLATLAGEA